MEKIDRRAARTKKALKAAMLECLKKKDISKITVSEIAEQADIGRGTFYLHYLDPYDLLEQIENETLNQISRLSTPVKDGWQYTHMLAYLERVCQYIKEHHEVFKILMNHQGGMRFMKKFKDHSLKIALDATGLEQLDSSERAYALFYVISGTMGIFQKWLEDGASMPPNRFAEIARNVIVGQPL